MAMYDTLHMKADQDEIYVSREMQEQYLIRCEGCIRMEENSFRQYAKNYFEPLIKGARAAETFEYDDTVNKNEFKRK